MQIKADASMLHIADCLMNLMKIESKELNRLKTIETSIKNNNMKNILTTARSVEWTEKNIEHTKFHTLLT